MRKINLNVGLFLVSRKMQVHDSKNKQVIKCTKLMLNRN